MTAYADLIVEAVRQSGLDGDVAAPRVLLDILAKTEKPLETLSNFDTANELFDTFYQDFGVLQRARAAGPPFQAEDYARCAALIRWLVIELRHWRTADDPRLAKLTALVIAAQTCDGKGQLWPLLPTDIEQNSELAEAFRRVVASFSVEFTARGVDTIPIWEGEAVQQLKEMEAAGDWGGIGDRWRAFENLLFGNAVQTQAVRFLFHFNRDGLVAALANVRQTAAAMLVVGILATEQRLELGVASSNHFVEFAAVYGSLAGRKRAEQLSVAEAQLLTIILLKVASDELRWAGWMKTFNAYPMRYPTLQASLGCCLATAPEHAVRAYVNSIVLFTTKSGYDLGRKNVAECLRAFRGVAPNDRRRALWTFAFDRWADWRFDHANLSAHLFEVNWSELDYAIVGYASECMDQAGRDAALDAIRRDLGQIDGQWHALVTDIVTAWNRLLSQFQPYARASDVLKTGEDWLSETKNYLPFDSSKDLYLAMKYRLL